MHVFDEGETVVALVKGEKEEGVLSADPDISR